MLGSSQEQKERNFFQEEPEFSTSSLIPKLLDKQVAKVSTEL